MGALDIMASVGGQLAGNAMGAIIGQNSMSDQVAAAKQMAIFNREQQMQLWRDTNYKAQADQMRKAGLNVGLMYGKGGGQGGSVAAAGGQMPSGYSGNNSNPMEVAASLANLELMKANVKKVEAETKNVEANTETTEKSRDTLIENMRQSGIGQWFDNMAKEFERKGWSPEDTVDVIKNRIYNYSTMGYNEASPMVQKFNADLFKTYAEQRNLDASALLSNEKAKVVWDELLVAQKNADANTINAKANELAKMWETGEFTNWKTWTELAKDAIDGIGTLIKNTKGIPTVKASTIINR